MKNMENFKQIFQGLNGQLSSKRVFGGIGFLAIIGIIIYLTIIKQDQPNILIEFMYTCAALLGLDSISTMFKKK